jgi:hypothetical protein
VPSTYHRRFFCSVQSCFPGYSIVPSVVLDSILQYLPSRAFHNYRSCLSRYTIAPSAPDNSTANSKFRLLIQAAKQDPEINAEYGNNSEQKMLVFTVRVVEKALGRSRDVSDQAPWHRTKLWTKCPSSRLRSPLHWSVAFAITPSIHHHQSWPPHTRAWTFATGAGVPNFPSHLSGCRLPPCPHFSADQGISHDSADRISTPPHEHRQ